MDYRGDKDAGFTWEGGYQYAGSLYIHSAAAILERALQADDPWMAIAFEASEVIETCTADHDLERRREMLFAIRALSRLQQPTETETSQD